VKLKVTCSRSVIQLESAFDLKMFHFQRTTPERDTFFSRRFPPTKPGRKRFFNKQRHSHWPPHENNELHIVSPVQNVEYNAEKKSQQHKINAIFYTWMKNCQQVERSISLDKLVTLFMYDDQTESNTMTGECNIHKLI